MGVFGFYYLGLLQIFPFWYKTEQQKQRKRFRDQEKLGWIIISHI